VLTIADFEPTVSFASAGFTVGESTPTAAIVVTRGGSASVPFMVNFATSNGTATAGTDYTTTSGTLTFAAGVTTQTVHVPIIPNTIVDGSRTVTLTLSGPTPTVRIVGTNPATLTITDDDVGGSLQFNQALYTVRESVSPVTVTVTRTGGAASGVTVNYAVANGTAVGGTNFTATSGTLTFAAGQSTLTFTVPILDDGVPTGDLAASLVLSAPGGGGVLGARSTATLKILDNEPTVQFSAPTYQVNEGGSISVTVVRSGPAGLPGTMTVAYATTDGTAINGTDYRAVSGTLTFGPGVASRTFSVPTINNNTQQNPGNRTLTATLSGVTGGTLGLQGTATLTVADNDVVGHVFFSTATYTARKNGGIAAITVRRDGTAAGATVAYMTVDGTAHAPANYTAKSGTLTFNPGQTSSNFYIPIIDDTIASGSLAFSITLTALPAPPGNANLSLGSPSTATVVIQDTNSGGIVQFTTNAFSGCTPRPCSAVLTIDRTQGAASGVSVDFATADGTGVAGTDYTPTTGTVVFGNNQRLATITIPLLATATPGNNFFVILGNVMGGGTLGGYSAVPVTIR
jgi:hypothetical protein